MISVSAARGECVLFLCQGDQGHPGSWVWIDGKDVDALYQEYKRSGAKIRQVARQELNRFIEGSTEDVAPAARGGTGFFAGEWYPIKNPPGEPGGLVSVGPRSS